jgi:multidrug efflux pump subunit AcrB
MLVDNAIVMLENIFRHRELAGDPEHAAHQGAGEVTSAVIASTATSLAAVVPFLLITGLAALIFRELILTISFAMLASLGTALSLVPMLAAQMGKVQRTSGLEHTRLIRRFDEGLDRVRVWYRDVARRAVQRRGWILGGAFATLGLSLLLVGGLGNEFLPTVDDGNLSVNLRLPPGATPTQTNELAQRLEAVVGNMPHVRHVFTTAGGFLFGGGTAARSGRGSINVILASATERDMSAGEWVAQLQQRIDSLAVPGARIFVRPPSIRGMRTNVSGNDVSINVQGDDLAELQRIGLDVIRRIQGIPGLEAVEPSADEASPQLVIALDRQRAADLGLNVAVVGQAVRVALDGAIPTRFTDRNQEYDIRVRLPREHFQNAEDLGSIALFAGAGRPIYLRDVATVQLTIGPTSIRRENQNRQYRVDGEVNDDIASVGEVNRAIRERLSDMRLPDGYGLVYGGEEETIRENQRNLMIVTLLAVFLVLVVMAVQYESVTNPLVILVSIPLALVGVILLLWVTHTPLSAPALLGVILLAGIVVNNAILLVEYVEQIRQEQNVSAVDAVVEAGAIRLRPILMTTTTTVLGMLPLAIGIGEGTELMRPLALAVVGGLSISMLLTLIVIPCAYLVMHDAAARLRGWVIGRRTEPAPEAAD